MRASEFDFQMRRLETRWKGVYVDELKKLIWREVGHFSSEWFEQAVDRLLGNSRQAPLVQDFAEAAAREREKVHASEKAKQRREAYDFFESKLASEEKKHIC